jgi:formate hydrogenlyase subunit 3/multisubunit Na+/H+ antiporter MnhD subunit
MTQTQILILLLSIIPFLNCLSSVSFPKLSDLSSRTTPIIFFAVLLVLNNMFTTDSSSLVLLALTTDISFVLGVDKVSINYLFVFNFFWIIFAFYSRRFLELKKVNDMHPFQMMSALAIAISSLIILSGNLLTILFFCYFLIILRYFITLKFFFQKPDKFSFISLTFLCLEPILLFVAVFLTYHVSGGIDFSQTILSSGLSPSVSHGFPSGIASDTALAPENLGYYKILFTIYFLGLFLSFIAPFYLLNRNIQSDPIITYSVFFLSAALSSFYLLIKLLGTILKVEEGVLVIFREYFIYCESFFLVIIFATSLFLILSRGIKSSFLYLFFHQLALCLFSIITFFIFQKNVLGYPNIINISFISLFLSTSLLCLCLSNVMLFLTRSEKKDLKGLFCHFKITISCLILGILSLIGLAPALSAIEKIQLIKIILDERLLISGLVLIINILTIVIFAWKLLNPLFLKSDQDKYSETDIELAKTIDTDSSLIVPILVTTVAMILLIFPFLNIFL